MKPVSQPASAPRAPIADDLFGISSTPAPATPPASTPPPAAPSSAPPGSSVTRSGGQPKPAARQLSYAESSNLVAAVRAWADLDEHTVTARAMLAMTCFPATDALSRVPFTDRYDTAYTPAMAYVALSVMACQLRTREAISAETFDQATRALGECTSIIADLVWMFCRPDASAYDTVSNAAAMEFIMAASGVLLTRHAPAFDIGNDVAKAWMRTFSSPIALLGGGLATHAASSALVWMEWDNVYQRVSVVLLGAAMRQATKVVVGNVDSPLQWNSTQRAAEVMKWKQVLTASTRIEFTAANIVSCTQMYYTQVAVLLGMLMLNMSFLLHGNKLLVVGVITLYLLLDHLPLVIQGHMQSITEATGGFKGLVLRPLLWAAHHVGRGHLYIHTVGGKYLVPIALQYAPEAWYCRPATGTVLIPLIVSLVTGGAWALVLNLLAPEVVRKDDAPATDSAATTASAPKSGGTVPTPLRRQPTVASIAVQHQINLRTTLTTNKVGVRSSMAKSRMGDSSDDKFELITWPGYVLAFGLVTYFAHQFVLMHPLWIIESVFGKVAMLALRHLTSISMVGGFISSMSLATLLAWTMSLVTMGTAGIAVRVSMAMSAGHTLLYIVLFFTGCQNCLYVFTPKDSLFYMEDMARLGYVQHGLITKFDLYTRSFEDWMRCKDTMLLSGGDCRTAFCVTKDECWLHSANFTRNATEKFDCNNTDSMLGMCKQCMFCQSAASLAHETKLELDIQKVNAMRLLREAHDNMDQLCETLRLNPSLAKDYPNDCGSNSSLLAMFPSRQASDSLVSIQNSTDLLYEAMKEELTIFRDHVEKTANEQPKYQLHTAMMLEAMDNGLKLQIAGETIEFVGIGPLKYHGTITKYVGLVNNMFVSFINHNFPLELLVPRTEKDKERSKHNRKVIDDMHNNQFIQSTTPEFRAIETQKNEVQAELQVMQSALEATKLELARTQEDIARRTAAIADAERLSKLRSTDEAAKANGTAPDEPAARQKIIDEAEAAVQAAQKKEAAAVEAQRKAENDLASEKALRLKAEKEAAEATKAKEAAEAYVKRVQARRDEESVCDPNSLFYFACMGYNAVADPVGDAN